MNVSRAPQRPQFEILLALDKLPSHLEPGYEGELDFSPLMEQIDKLREQQVVLCLASWIWRNASWLETEGFLLHCNWLPDGNGALGILYGSRDVRAHVFEQAGLSASRHASVEPLICQLSDLSEEHTWPTIAKLVCEFNETKWDPDHAHRILIKELEENIDDAEAWLDAHRAYHQAESLHHKTPNTVSEQARGRPYDPWQCPPSMQSGIHSNVQDIHDWHCAMRPWR